MRNERFARLPFFQAECLCTELDMVVEPGPLVSMLVLHRKKHPPSLLDHIGKAGQVQGFAVEVQARGLYLSLCRRVGPSLMDALVGQRPFQHKFIDQHLALHELVVKTSWTILKRIERGDGYHLHMRWIYHGLPSCCLCFSVHVRCLQGRAVSRVGAGVGRTWGVRSSGRPWGAWPS